MQTGYTDTDAGVVRKAWKSRLYSPAAAEKWVRGLFQGYARATKVLTRILRKSIKDVEIMASMSQYGWEAYKRAVKRIHSWVKTWNLEDLPVDTLCKRIKSDNEGRLTIQELSSDVVFFQKNYGGAYFYEANYLTEWYKVVI